MKEMLEKLIFEKGPPARRAYSLPDLDVPEAKLQDLLPKDLIADQPLSLPEVSEIELIRHFTNLSRLNYGVDLGFYPLGSCTMKYNPKVNEEAAKTPGLMNAHPLQPEALSQGALRMMYELEGFLREIGGVDRVSSPPVAGAPGGVAGPLGVRGGDQGHGNTE